MIWLTVTFWYSLLRTSGNANYFFTFNYSKNLNAFVFAVLHSFLILTHIDLQNGFLV